MKATFYRAISFAELADFRQSGRLQIGPGSCEGKHLARSLADARKWGRALFPNGGFAIVRVVVDVSVADNWMRWTKLDGIGPAVFATIEDLKQAIIEEVIDES